MSSKIYEITQMMNDGRVIRGDVNHAAGMIKSMLSEKYIAPITRAITAENKKARKNPSKEARLLEAIKPFVDAGSHSTIERAVDLLYMIETLRGLTGQMPGQAYVPPRGTRGMQQDNSSHADGVYDVDERCVEHSRQPALMPLLVLMAMVARG